MGLFDKIIHQCVVHRHFKISLSSSKQLNIFTNDTKISTFNEQ